MFSNSSDRPSVDAEPQIRSSEQSTPQVIRLVDGSECQMNSEAVVMASMARPGLPVVIACRGGWSLTEDDAEPLDVGVRRYSQMIAAGDARTREMMELRDEEREGYGRDESRRASSRVCADELQSPEARR